MNCNVIRFQQDNATPYTSEITQDWFSVNGFIFEAIRDWAAQSPNLNPIEHVWYQLKRRLNTYPTSPTTKEELEARITSEWYKFTKNDCLKYIDSMPACIKAGGDQAWWITYSFLSCFLYSIKSYTSSLNHCIYYERKNPTVYLRIFTLAYISLKEVELNIHNLYRLKSSILVFII